MKTLNYFKSAIQRKEGTGNSVRGYTRRALRGIALVVGSLAAIASPVGNVAMADIGATHTTLISEFPSFNTPSALDGRVEAIAVEGDTVFVGGTFTQIQEPLGGEILDQPYLFAYSKSTGNIIRSFLPELDNVVQALETTGEGTGIFVGGVFSIVNGERNNRGLVKLDDNGVRVPGFVARPDALIATMVRLDDTLYIGGNFSSISGQPVENLAAVDTVTGALDTSLSLDFDGAISTFRFDGTLVTRGVQGVDDIDITTDGRLMAVAGNFQTIDGLDRIRLGVIELDGTARVSDWNTDVFDVQCPALLFPQYIRGIDISPDDQYLVVGTTGFRRIAEPACDTVTRFELDDLTDADMQPTWVNYSGGDTFYDVVSTDHAIYVGGHFRWLNNDTSFDGNSAGVGSIERAGMAALDPKNGLTYLNWRSDRNPRGLGTFALIAEDEGLYIGDDTEFMNGNRHARLKFLPIGTEVIVRPDTPTVPGRFLFNDFFSEDSVGQMFDGISLGSSASVPDQSFGRGAVGAVVVQDKVFYFLNDGRIVRGTFTDGAFDSFIEVDRFGLTENEWPISRIGGIYFDYDQGRVYYTLSGDSQLYWRAFTPDGPYFGNDEYIAEQQADINWSDVTGMDVVDGFLYFTRAGSLYRAQVDGYEPIAGTTELVSDSTIGQNNSFLTFISDDVMQSGLAGAGAQLEFASSGTTAVNTFQTFDFEVEAGEPVELRLSWLDPSAQLDLRVRDANGVLVAANTTNAGSPKWLTVPAGVGGTYIASVQIREGGTAYTLQVNPTEQRPAPLADFEFSGSGSASQGRFQVFPFNVQAGELIEAQVNWDPMDGDDVRVFLRDESSGQVVQIDRDLDGAGAVMLSAVSSTTGTWSIAVSVNSADTVSYDVLVDTTTDFTLPEPLADFEFSSSGSANAGRFQVFRFDVVAGELVEAQVNWENVDGDDVRVFLRDESTGQVVPIDRDIDGAGAVALSAVSETTGTWSIAVAVTSANTVSYDVLVDTTTDFTLPEPLADFEFSSSGSANAGRFQVFRFDVAVGELVMAQVNWENTEGDDVRVFLRDESTGQVVPIGSDFDGDGVALVTAVSATNGQWSVAVSVNSANTVSYDVLVDTTPGFEPPVPLADFEFSSSGSLTDGRFQVFRFDVIAGETVEAQVNWGVTDADVRVFLRDETNAQIARDIEFAGADSSTLSAVAQSSGQWSVAVQVNEADEISYDVLVDTILP